MRGRWVKRGEVEGGDEVGRGKGYSGKGEGGGDDATDERLSGDI